jgi:RNA polymerase sigma-70 factor (ECF subfamily)
MEISPGEGSKWLDDLYQSNHAAVFKVCSSILRNPEDAADATQQVFLIALESMDPTAKSAVARGWLLTVARNHCLDLLRRRKRLGKALVTLGSDAHPGTDLETAVADRDFVDVVFKQLSKRERQALWQSAVESRPLADIASRLQLSYMAAAQVLHRARRRAAQAAGRVAVVFGIFRVVRHRPGVGSLLAAHRLAAVAAVPLIVVSMNSSSPDSMSPERLASPTPGVVSVPAGPVVLGAPPLNAGGVSGTVQGLVPGSAGALNSATDTVNQLLKEVSGKLVIATPSALPSLPAVPSPSAIP